jgi:phosphatidylglycerophosphate synthase
MKDVYFTVVVAVLTATSITLYGVRLARRGASRTERVAQIGGGTRLLGRELVEMGYWAMSPLARACVALGVSANGVTWFALVVGVGAGVALGFGLFGLAALLALVCGVCDVLDGQVARLTGTSSPAGEILDAAVDRVTELCFLGGLVVFYRDAWAAQVMTLAALGASFMVSYATAKAEALDVPPPRGPMRRHERGTYLIVGAGLTSFFGPAIAARWPDAPPAVPELVAVAVIAVVGTYSAVLRLTRTAALVRARPAPRPGAR